MNNNFNDLHEAFTFKQKLKNFVLVNEVITIITETKVCTMNTSDCAVVIDVPRLENSLTKAIERGFDAVLFCDEKAPNMISIDSESNVLHFLKEMIDL